MESNLFKKVGRAEKKGAKEDINQKKELIPVERDILLQAENERELLAEKFSDTIETNKDNVSDSDENNDGGEKKDKTFIKKIGEKFVIVCCLGTITMGAIGCGHANTRYISNQFERNVFGDTLRNIDRKAESESNAMLSVERDEANAIRRSGMDVHSKKAYIHDAYTRRTRVN